MGVYRKSTGDGFMLEFEGAPEAVDAAFELRRLARVGNLPLGQDAHMHVRIALHLADYVADEFDIYGSGRQPGQPAAVAGPPRRHRRQCAGARPDHGGRRMSKTWASTNCGTCAARPRCIACWPRTRGPGTWTPPTAAREGEPG
jgi:hypothetical protein